MLANRLFTLRRLRRALSGLACAFGFACTGAGVAHAAGLTVLMADDGAAHVEFVRQLRESQAAGSRFDLVRVGAGQPAAEPVVAGAPAVSADDDRVTAGVKTRSMRASLPAAADAPITMAVGLVAARSAIERHGPDPLVLAMLSRLDYESLKASPALRKPERPIGVLLRDPSMSDQLALIDALLPQKRRLGIVATAESEPILRELQRAAGGWDLQIEYAPDAQSLASALRLLVPRSDALMVLPDQIGDSQAATLAVLRAGAGAGLPVFGASEGLVRSGGLAAAVSTPSQLAHQARALARKLASLGTGAGAASNTVWVEAATPATVRINANVARSLNLRVPEERELTERVTAAR